MATRRKRRGDFALTKKALKDLAHECWERAGHIREPLRVDEDAREVLQALIDDPRNRSASGRVGHPDAVRLIRWRLQSAQRVLQVRGTSRQINRRHWAVWLMITRLLEIVEYDPARRCRTMCRSPGPCMPTFTIPQAGVYPLRTADGKTYKRHFALRVEPAEIVRADGRIERRCDACPSADDPTRAKCLKTTVIPYNLSEAIAAVVKAFNETGLYLLTEDNARKIYQRHPPSTREESPRRSSR